jgi:hydroxyacylglutathione hydrolase
MGKDRVTRIESVEGRASMEFFRVERVTDSLRRITDVTNVHMYLAEGRDRAVLVDTGTGIGDLRAFIATLTSLPLTVVVTHGHADHAGGASWFGEAWLAPADEDLAARHGNRAFAKDYARIFLGDAVDRLADADFAPERPVRWLPLRHGQVLDLGGTTLEAVDLTGHTQGMTGILFREDRKLLYGDGCNPFVFLFDSDSSTVADYRETLVGLRAYDARYDEALLSHILGSLPKALLESCIAVCDDLLAGRTDAFPFEFMGRTHPVAKRMSGTGRRADGGLGNIVYDPERIR